MLRKTIDFLSAMRYYYKCIEIEEKGGTIR